ncbi:MAG: ABC transporter substrate-binding protein [Victivallaceae bacterium]|nr:ABC transporter substrate-binding protein [Victivallaceae bacterium]
MAVAAESAAPRWRIMLPWQPQAQFAGFYVAADKGIFAAHGLDVELVHLERGDDLFAAMKSGERVAVASPLVAALQVRDKGVAAVNIIQIGRRSSILLVARASSGIKQCSDLNTPRRDGTRRRVAVWDTANFGVAPRLWLNRDRVNVEIVPLYAGVDLFLWDAVDAISVMDYNEFYELLQAGFRSDELCRIRLSETPFDFPEDGLYVDSGLLASSPGECEKLAAAVAEGMRLACRDKPAALGMVRRRIEAVRGKFDFSHQSWMIGTYFENAAPDRAGFGVLPRDKFNTVTRALLRGKVIATAPRYDEFTAEMAVDPAAAPVSAANRGGLR